MKSDPSWEVVNAHAQVEARPLVLKARDVCEMLNMSKWTLERMVRAGTLAPLPLKGVRSRRFATAAVLKLVNG